MQEQKWLKEHEWTCGCAKVEDGHQTSTKRERSDAVSFWWVQEDEDEEEKKEDDDEEEEEEEDVQVEVLTFISILAELNQQSVSQSIRAGGCLTWVTQRGCSWRRRMEREGSNFSSSWNKREKYFTNDCKCNWLVNKSK